MQGLTALLHALTALMHDLSVLVLNFMGSLLGYKNSYYRYVAMLVSLSYASCVFSGYKSSGANTYIDKKLGC